jgi:UDP-N-acetylmuramyl tripeptide synthase
MRVCICASIPADVIVHIFLISPTTHTHTHTHTQAQEFEVKYNGCVQRLKEGKKEASLEYNCAGVFWDYNAVVAQCAAGELSVW